MLQAMGGCTSSSKAKGQYIRNGVLYSAGACGEARCADPVWWWPLISGCSGGPTVTSCSAAAVLRRLAPVMSTCARGLTEMSCSCTAGWPVAKAAGEAAGWRDVV